MNLNKVHWKQKKGKKRKEKEKKKEERRKEKKMQLNASGQLAVWFMPRAFRLEIAGSIHSAKTIGTGA